MEVEIVDKQLYLNGILFEFPGTAAPVGNFTIEAVLSPRDNLERVRVPQKGERVSIDSLRLFEFDYFLSLIRQENPGAVLSQTADLYLNGRLKNDIRLQDFLSDKRREDSTLNFDAMDWLELQNVLNFLEARGDSGEYRFIRTLYMDGKRLSDYQVRENCFFFMGDNWEQSLDSRYYGYVAASSIVGRASFIYWSWHKGGPRFGRLFLFI
jgi:signal peptidase I